MKIPPLLVVAATATVLGGCKPANSAAPKPVPAVSVSQKLTEAQLAIVTLTPDAEKRLGITTAAVENRKVDNARSYGGDLILPLGRGTDTGGAKSIYALLPSMTAADLVAAAQAQVDADGRIAAAKAQHDGALLALQRAEELVRNNAGLGRAVEEARTQAQLAEVALRTARERRALLGSPVFDAVNSKQLWVRVSVYAGELPQIRQDAPASVSVLGHTGGPAPALAATPVAVPFSAAASPTTAELFYEVKTDAAVPLRPGMKVAVSLPLQGSAESLAVPAGAILYDIHGNTWVYESLGAQAYSRRRVEVRRTVGDIVLLARGPQPGTKVVTAGAAELFGTEFGAGK